jgi:hypothetical protein
LAHVMLFDAFATVTFVPFKSFDLREIVHNVYYHNIRYSKRVGVSSSTRTAVAPGVRLRKQHQKKS